MDGLELAEVEAVLGRMKNRKAAGLDGVRSEVLKYWQKFTQVQVVTSV